MSTYEISKSSLLSLKAEILRKQEELTKVRSDNVVKILNLKKNAPLDLKNKGVEQRQEKDRDVEEEDLLKKSRQALEAKSKLYEKLSANASALSDDPADNRYLVRFDKKTSNREDRYQESESEDESYPTEYENAKNQDEEWVEYVDCLGRTRTCLRKDLRYMKAKDEELRRPSHNDEDEEEAREKERYQKKQEAKEKYQQKYVRETTTDDKTDDPDSVVDLSENNELLSSDMRREFLRRQWEKEEEELRNKNKIHYQDILFDEARSHGVGYYGFSKDEEERAIQQENLRKLRKETAQQQEKSQTLRALREKQLAARAKAARNRKRARMGLPPEEDEPEEQIVEPEPQKTEEKEPEKEDEKKKERERKKHIRPWDIGKEGVKEHYEYTQEEWVEKRRKDRPSEFAPPRAFQAQRSTDHFTDDIDKNLYFSTKRKTKDQRIKTRPSINPYKTSETYEPHETQTATSIPIRNELDEDDNLLKDYKSSGERRLDSSDESDRGRGVEIAPPPTFDYYGPSGAKKVKVGNEKTNLEDSISAGLKFLRQQAEQKSASTKRDADMFIM